IVFVGSQEDNAIMPAIILGVRDKNLYLTETGHWRGNYTPAFVRRYPFVFSSNNEGNTLTLCIDEDFEGCNQDGRGERLFDADGEQTQFLQGTLEFLKGYQAHFQRTQAFCQRLNEFDLFEPMQASLTLKSGETLSLDGFMAVSREKLKALTGEQLATLAALDELELIYLHLQSIRNFSEIGELIAETETHMVGDRELSSVA
ncbi:MAG: SapC family protein, partial [Cyanobacteria bacterium J06598_3]